MQLLMVTVADILAVSSKKGPANENIGYVDQFVIRIHNKAAYIVVVPFTVAFTASVSIFSFLATMIFYISIFSNYTLSTIKKIKLKNVKHMSSS